MITICLSIILRAKVVYACTGKFVFVFLLQREHVLVGTWTALKSFAPTTRVLSSLSHPILSEWLDPSVLSPMEPHLSVAGLELSTSTV